MFPMWHGWSHPPPNCGKIPEARMHHNDSRQTHYPSRQRAGAAWGCLAAVLIIQQLLSDVRVRMCFYHQWRGNVLISEPMVNFNEEIPDIVAGRNILSRLVIWKHLWLWFLFLIHKTLCFIEQPNYLVLKQRKLVSAKRFLLLSSL